VKHSQELRFISAQVPMDLRAALEQAAQQNDRSMSAEIRRALSEHLSSPRGRHTASREPAVLFSTAGSSRRLEEDA